MQLRTPFLASSRLSTLGVAGLLLVALGAQASAPASQYAPVTNSSQVVFDRKTQLTWERSPKTMPPLNFSAADQYCRSLRAAGATSWRLPTMKELVTIVDVRATKPAIDSMVFPGTFQDNYWTKTPYQGVDSNGKSKCADCNWNVDFATGKSIQFSRAAHQSRVRCVHN